MSMKLRYVSKIIIIIISPDESNTGDILGSSVYGLFSSSEIILSLSFIIFELIF